MDKEYISQMVDDIFDGNSTAAKEKFDDLLSTKVSSALDQRKIDIAQSLYTQPEMPPEAYEDDPSGENETQEEQEEESQ